MIRTVIASLLALFVLASQGAPASAQRYDVKKYDGRYIQISSHIDVREARRVARRYRRRFPDTRIYYSRSGYYAVTVIVTSTRRARILLARLRDSGAIPYDSYLTGGTRYLRELRF